jgi:hypothetical protein
MATREDTIKLSYDFECDCPNQITVEVKDSAFLTPAGKFFVATIIELDGAAVIPAGTAFKIRYDDAVLAVPANGIASCDIERICCQNCTDRYILGLIEALGA